MTLTWTPHLRLTWGGILGTSATEIWSNGVKWLLGNPVSQLTEIQLQQVADRSASALGTWFTHQSTNIHSDAHLKWIKAVWVLANGRQRDVNTAYHEFAPMLSGNISLTPVIWEQSYALTFRTGLKRGRAHSGRIYPPISGEGPESGTPYVNAGLAEAMAQKGADLLTGLKVAIEGTTPAPAAGGYFAVVSPGNSVTGTSPVTAKIISVVCDRTPDIQHRRTNRVPRLEGLTAVLPA